MKIVQDKIKLDEIREMAKAMFGDMVKAVVDVDRQIIAVDAELHADLEALLLDDGSQQKNLWGINFYPDLNGDEFVEFDSMINMRPSQGNRSRGVNDPLLRQKILELVKEKVIR
jgi:hypothetical protein